jgi:hypothetical protein
MAASTYDYDFQIVGRQFKQIGIAQVVRGFLTLEQLSIHADQREIWAQGALEEYAIVFLLGFDQTFFVGDQGLLERT